MLSLNDLAVIYPEQLWVLSPEEQEKAWQLAAKQLYSNAAARRTAFLNCLCANTFLTWLKEDSDLEALEIWPQQADLPSFWEMVNGTGLTLGEFRLVLIPTDKSNLSFQIPQEWVNIPSWAAHYYVAVQFNLEECWLRVWGYATHQQIQEEGRYDPMDRTYSLDREDLIEDLNVMWVAQELCPPKKLEVKPLPSLSAAQTEKLLTQLGQWTPYSPRLDVSFEQWAALLASDESRQHLYRQRLKQQDGAVDRSHSSANNLSQWFQNLFEAGWQSLDTLLGTEQRILAIQFRSDSEFKKIQVKGAKVIDLGMQLGGEAVVLLIGLTLEADRTVGIRVRLHPAVGETYLPSDVRLVLLSQSGVVLQEVQSRCHDNYIQLKRFKSPTGRSFRIQVALGDVTIEESFMLEPLVG